MENVKKFNLPKYKIFENKIENFLYFAETSCIWLKTRYNKKQKNHSGCNGSAGTSQITAYILTDFFFQMYCCHFIVMQHSRCGNHTNSTYFKDKASFMDRDFSETHRVLSKIREKEGRRENISHSTKEFYAKAWWYAQKNGNSPSKAVNSPLMPDQAEYSRNMKKI